MNLFRMLENHGILADYIEFFDWIFADKFDESRWSNKNRVQSFTKRLYKYPCLPEASRVYDAQKNIKFPTSRPSSPKVFMSDGGSYGRDWIRHIRNGIAHGHCEFVEKKGDYFLELIDYSDSSRKNQTAYMFIPLEYLLQTKKDYDELDKRWAKPPRVKKK